MKKVFLIREQAQQLNKIIITLNDHFTDILYGGFFVVTKIFDDPKWDKVVQLTNIDNGEKIHLQYSKMQQISGDRIMEDDDFRFFRTKKNGAPIEKFEPQIEKNKERKRKINTLLTNHIEVARYLTGVQHPTLRDFNDVSDLRINDALELNELN